MFICRFCCINQNFGRRYSKTVVYGVCINLQADFVGVGSSFTRTYASRLKVKQKAKIINYRWAGFFGELLVCFVANVMVKRPFNLYWKIFWLEQHWYDLTQPSSTVSLVLFPSCLSMHGLQNWKVRRHACEWVTHNYRLVGTPHYCIKITTIFKWNSNKMKVLIIHNHLHRNFYNSTLCHGWSI